MTQPTIRILLIDDHTLVRQGLRSLLDPDPEFQVVGEASTGADALALARRVQADVAIVDIRLPDMDGPSVCQSLRNMQPRIAILVLSAYMDSSLVSASLKAGARGYLLKDAENLHLKDQIRSVYQGYSAYDPRTANIVTQLALGHNPQEGGLKPREMEILRCMAGCSTPSFTA